LSLSASIRRTFSALSVYNYRVFWLGQLISLSGTWMQTIAQSWLVLQLTNSPSALGFVTMLQFLPITVMALFGGVLADRLPKHRVLIITQSSAAIQAGILAILVISHHVQLWHVYVLAFCLGVINSIDNPTRQAFVVELVGPDKLANAVALNSMLFNSARIIGPSIGGLMIGWLGTGGAFAANALSFLAVILGLLIMRTDEFVAVARSPRGRVLTQVAEGIKYAFSHSDILLVLLLMACLGIFGYNFTVMLPLIDKYILGAGPEVLGILTSAMGVGSVLAALAVAYAGKARVGVMLAGALIFSFSLLLVGVSRLYPLTLLGLFILGFASVTFSSNANTRLQLLAPDHLRGRIMSLYFLVFAGSTPFGGVIVGSLSALIGVSLTLQLMAIICLAGTLIAMLFVYICLQRNAERKAESLVGIGGSSSDRRSLDA